MHILNFIHWYMDPIIFEIGPISLRWYGLFFGASFLFGYFIMNHFFKKEGVSDEWLDKLTLYMAAGTFLGARLGHCLFYEPEVYLADPIRILKIWEGGLASHGAAIGIITSLIIFSRFVSKKSPLWILDRIVIVVALSGLFIRSGNLMNSEIIGNETTKPWGFVFQHGNAGDQSGPYFFAERKGEKIKLSVQVTEENKGSSYDLFRKIDGEEKHVAIGQVLVNAGEAGSYTHVSDIPGSTEPVSYFLSNSQNNKIYSKLRVVGRHPTQLYEAFAYTLIFGFLMFLYFRQRGKVPYGQLFGLFLILVFGARFLIEFVKEEQVGFEESMALNMGQLLSIPLVLAGIFFFIRSRRKDAKTE